MPSNPAVRKFRPGFDKLKCRFCRVAKKPCTPNNRQWPGGKCDRCEDHKLECGRGEPPRHTKPLVARSLQESGADTASSQLIPLADEQGHIFFHQLPVTASEYNLRTFDLLSSHSHILEPPRVVPNAFSLAENIRDALLLLSLHTVLMMSLRELRMMAKEMVDRFLEDPNPENPSCSMSVLNNTFREITNFGAHLKEKLFEMDTGTMLAQNIALLQSEEISSSTTWIPNNDYLCNIRDHISKLHADGHSGFAHVLQIHRLLNYPSLIASEAARFIQYRTLFLTQSEVCLAKFDLASQIPAVIQNTQWFIPCVLLRSPIIARHFQELGMTDCLGRSYYHVLLDAHLPVKWPRSHINSTDVLGRSALYYACRQGESDQVDKLLKSGANIRQAALNGLGPVHLAASLGHTLVCTKLIEHSNQHKFSIPSLGLFRDGSDRTPLMWAAWSGDQLTLELFVKITPNAQACNDNHKINAVGLAAYRNHLHVVRYLADNGFAIDHADAWGRTPFWYAAKRSHHQMMNFLAARGVDVDHRDNQGRTAFAEAAHRGDVETIEQLLRFNEYYYPSGKEKSIRVDLCSEDRQGKSPLELAAEAGQSDCVEKIMQQPLKNITKIRKAYEIAQQNKDSKTMEAFYFWLHFLDGW